MGRAAARRTALASQGFGRPQPATVTMRQFQGEISRLAQLQIDSVNVAVRAHLMPVFSRLGPYPTTLLDRATGTAPRRLFEYWGHAASFIDVQLWPALRFRQRRSAEEAWQSVSSLAAARPDLVEQVLRQVADVGPVTARELDPSRRERTQWGWNWGDTKHVLEWLLHSGQITSAGRNRSFERRYAVPEAVLPAAVLAAPELPEPEARQELARRAARALGIASLDCIADYFRTKRAETAVAVAELERTGELTPVVVDGWPVPLWRWHEARAPRAIGGAALVSPFDNLIFHRPRALALFDLDYRIEIYVPEARRRFGYYVYPLLLGEDFVARFDLAARRATGRLVVQASWREPGSTVDDAAVARAAAGQLRSMADWIGLGEIEVVPKGDLAGAVGRAVTAG